MSTTSIFDLPKELRLQIWDHAIDLELKDQGGCIIVGKPPKWPWNCRPEPYHPSLLQVCSLIRREALSKLYQDRPVILLLRYRESRSQIQRWIRELSHHASIHNHITTISIRYFETAHRSTSLLVDCQEWAVLNRHEWIHPLSKKPLRLLRMIEDALGRTALEQRDDVNRLGDGIDRLVTEMIYPLRESRLLSCESMANVRLHGYTDFQLRFEVIRILYHTSDWVVDHRLNGLQSVKSRMERSRLLELPTELRLDIFEYLLQNQGSLTVGGCYSPSFLQFSVPPAIFGGDLKLTQAQQPAITQVSRQLRNETLALFYRQNRFLLALHYRRARIEVCKFLDIAQQSKEIASNLQKITIKHRFGILDFRGTIDFDFKTFSILGPHLWYNSIPPIYITQIEDIVDDARQAERSDLLIVDTLRRLVEAALSASIASLQYPGVLKVDSKSSSNEYPSIRPDIQHLPGDCPLLKLPKELRLLVLENYLDPVPTLVKLEQYHNIYSGRRCWQPPLALTNARLRAEILPLFYRRCRFHLQGFNEDGDCEVETFLARTEGYQALHENIRIVVLLGFILHSGRWLGEFDLGSFRLKVDRHWKHEMEGAYSGMIEDLEDVFQQAKQEVGPGDSRAPVLRELLAVMRARGVFL
ncbi:hypothetical protein AC579_4104 [Pseudocercospora musae]|uniref:2EXR domain-containing protein n=1 Tax=Pseudocercospora musae TaxID=113226 RepID=A0A139I3M9_9PEZI|nr:hypothetical protein AC579_4104 [Pseudocercospora musae]